MADGHPHNSRLRRLGRGHPQSLRTRHLTALLSPIRARSPSQALNRSRRALPCRKIPMLQLGLRPAGRSCRLASWNRISSVCRHPRRLLRTRPFRAPAQQDHRIRMRSRDRRNSRNNPARPRALLDTLLSLLLLAHLPGPRPVAPPNQASSNQLPSNNP
jgi:hypothetical protein